MKFSNSKGITLISVVITVIVMIIIASVAISNVVGENSAIDKAENAVETEEYRSKKEALQQYLNKYNSKSFVVSLDTSSDFKGFLKSELGLDCYENPDEEQNDFAVFNSNQFKFFSKNNNSFVRMQADGGYYYYLKYLDETFCVKEVDEICSFTEMPEKWENIINYVDWEVDNIVTSEEKKIETSGSYAVIENLDLKDFSYDIPAGETVTLKLLADMEITNANLAKPRAAINLNEGSTLNLQVEANVTVNSTYGEDADGAIAGKGGYAGIHVPESATLILSGSGTLKCYGGDAGDGPDNYGIGGVYTAGGGGAGAGIGGNGGAGSEGYAGKSRTTKICEDGHKR